MQCKGRELSAQTCDAVMHRVKRQHVRLHARRYERNQVRTNALAQQQV